LLYNFPPPTIFKMRPSPPELSMRVLKRRDMSYGRFKFREHPP